MVQTAWEGITFNRYYHGQTHWVTVPPIDSHKVHRNDLMFAKMNQPDPMVPVLREIVSTLQSGHDVWLAGNMLSAAHLDPPPTSQPVKWVGTYLIFWNAQVATFLREHALQEHVLEMPVDEPVCRLEKLSLTRFTGYKPEMTGSPSLAN